MSELPTIEQYDDLDRILDMVWAAGVDPTSRHTAIKQARAHLTRIMDRHEVEGQIKGMRKILDLLEKYLNHAYRAQIYQWIAELTHQAQAGGEDEG